MEDPSGKEILNPFNTLTSFTLKIKNCRKSLFLDIFIPLPIFTTTATRFPRSIVTVTVNEGVGLGEETDDDNVLQALTVVDVS